MTTALQGMGHSAKGVDKIGAGVLLKWNQPSLVGYFNLVMAVKRLPTPLAVARVAFIPKVDYPEDPWNPSSNDGIVGRALQDLHCPIER